MPHTSAVVVNYAQLTITQNQAYSGRGNSVALHRVSIEGQSALFKEYKPGALADESILIGLVEWRLRLSPEDRARLDARTAFPTHVVVRDAIVVGVCMPEAGKRFANESATRSRPRALDYLSMTPEHAKNVSQGYYDYPHKLAVLGDFLETVCWLHAKGVVVGDLNAENVLITGTPDDVGSIVLDCDSFWTGEGSAFPLAEPEMMNCPFVRDRFTRESDLYKFALLTTRCLQEHNSDPNIDEDFLRKLMPSEDVICLVDTMLSQTPPDIPRAAALARTWQRRVTPSGVMLGSNDELWRWTWVAGSVRSPHLNAPAPPTSLKPVSTDPNDPVWRRYALMALVGLIAILLVVSVISSLD